jgi:hypothetical protein
MHTVSNKQVAVIALIGVLVTAAASFWSAELGSRRSSQSATATIERQLNGESDRSKAEFLRGQRQEVYGWIVTDERELTALEEDMYNDITSSTRRKAERAARGSRSDFLDPFNKRLEKYKRNGPVIEIMASPAVRDTYSALISSRDTLHLQLYGLLQCRADAACDMNVKEKEYSDSYRYIEEQRTQLVSAARRDMEAE